MPLARRTFDHFWEYGQPEILSLHTPNSTDGQTVLKPGRPIANAGVSRINDLSAPVAFVILNASVSAFASSFQWSVASPVVNLPDLIDANTATPAFFPNATGLYTLNLTVNNGQAISTSLVNINVGTIVPVSFNVEIKPIFLEVPFLSCDWCHTKSNDSFERDMLYIDAAHLYDRIVERVNINDPLNSLILTKPSGKHHFGGVQEGFGTSFPGSPPSFTNYNLILRWILEGMPNN